MKTLSKSMNSGIVYNILKMNVNCGECQHYKLVSVDHQTKFEKKSTNEQEIENQIEKRI